MPIYEYQCRACGYEFETLQKVSEDPLTDCPDCAKPQLQKLVSVAGFRLKGSGWYETDFKTKGNKKNLSDSSSDKSEKKTTTEKSDKPQKTKKASGSTD